MKFIYVSTYYMGLILWYRKELAFDLSKTVPRERIKNVQSK